MLSHFLEKAEKNQNMEKRKFFRNSRKEKKKILIKSHEKLKLEWGSSQKSSHDFNFL